MNKKIKRVLEEKGLEVKKNNAYGIIEGYEVNASYDVFDLSYPVLFSISCYLNNEQKEVIINKFKSIKYRFLNVSFSFCGIVIRMNGWTGGSCSKKLKEFIELTINWLKEMNINGITHSPISGVLIENPKVCHIHDEKITMTEDEYLNLKAEIETENKEFESQPNNYFMGFLGACLGGLIGAVLSFILLMVGVVSAFSGYLASYLGTMFYKQMKGKVNKFMIVIAFFTSIVFILLSVLFAYIFISGGVSEFASYMKDKEFSNALISDMVMALIFTLLGLIYPVYLINKETKRTKLN